LDGAAIRLDVPREDTMTDAVRARERMVTTQIAARGVRDPAVLAAMRSVPREQFVPEAMEEFAYEDSPLPIEEGQTISQPYIVAAMITALRPRPTDRVLEVGTGSGYAAAVLSRVVAAVYTIERHAPLARVARERYERLGYGNIEVLVGDGTLGWPGRAPFDGIIVTAGGSQVPASLTAQLKVGGRLVIPVGETPREQELLRITRVSADRLEREELGPVRFVPLIGAEGWPAAGEESPAPIRRAAGLESGHPAVTLLRESGERIQDIESVSLDPLLERVGDARIVLLGEATHGTSEFYRMRARITRELIARKGFTQVALEADWPDAARVDRYVRHLAPRAEEGAAFSRFPTWMWRNREFGEFAEWLRAWNGEQQDPARRAAIHGLDLYSLFTSIQAVLRYLEQVDPPTAAVARERYACLTPWQRDPAVYGRLALTGRYRSCEQPVVDMLSELLSRRLELVARDGDQYFDALQNARLVSDAERYYRIMYYGSVDSWNLRDTHMFDTLRQLLVWRGPEAKMVVWEHNSHVGDASATELGARGEHNVGQLSRRAFGSSAYLVGFGTDHGTVAAASDWDGPMERKRVREAHPESYERLCHDTGVPAFLLPLRCAAREEVREELTPPRLERAIGVIYRPETELQSHYFEASLPRQFDEYCWFDETRAVAQLAAPVPGADLPDTWPFGL
jgi:protein-L-isoaspartate(D-aspartate) O-methyltransferase